MGAALKFFSFPSVKICVLGIVYYTMFYVVPDSKHQK